MFSKMVSNAIKYEWKPETRGTKQKTTDIEDRRIVSYSEVYRFASFRDIKSELNLGISDVTIRRRLLNQNFSARSPRKVPLPSPRHIKARLSLAKTYLNWPVSDGVISFGLMGQKSCYLVELVHYSISDDLQTRSITQNTQ